MYGSIPRTLPLVTPQPQRLLVLATRAIVALVILVVCLAISFALVFTAPEVHQVQEAAPPPEILVIAVEPTEVRRQWRGYGTAEAEVAADVPARVTATVADVPAESQEGVVVRAGQVLVRLDATDFQRRVEQAEQSLAAIHAQLQQLATEEETLRERIPIEDADVAVADRESTRIRELMERGAARQQDVDTAERNLLAAKRNRWQVTQAIAQIEARRAALVAQLSAQEAALRQAKEDLGRTQIASPIDGVIQSIGVKVGESVSAGQVVARVANLSVIEVPLRLPSGAREHLRRGDQAVLSVANRPELCWNAVVERLAPEDDPATRTMTVYLDVDQRHAVGDLASAQPILHPGRFVEASITRSRSESRWVVPRRSVRGGRIFLVENGVLRSVPVEVDFSLEGSSSLARYGLPDDQWAVLSETSAEAVLAPGALVVVNASTLLADGERVTPVFPSGGTATGIADRGGAPPPAEATP